MREICGELFWARELDGRPGCIPKGRPRGVKAVGVRFENKVGKQFGEEAVHGPWFEYLDSIGQGYCQPDFILRSAQGLFVVEVKLSWVEEAFLKLERLYRPVVEKCLEVPSSGIVVVKNLRAGMSGKGIRVVHTMEEAFRIASPGREVVVHWSGFGDLTGKAGK